jgi:hypothetical protein
VIYWNNRFLFFFRKIMSSLFGFLTFVMVVLFFFDEGKTVRHLIDAVSGNSKKTKKQKKLEGEVKSLVQSKLSAAEEEVSKLYLQFNGDTQAILLTAPNEETKELWRKIIDKLETLN